MNLSYIPLAIKYRPTNFSQLQGQETLVKTLNYCIISEKLSRSYLLSGIRGVGKTTSARIIAKTINCTDKKIINELVTACNICENCLNCINNSHPDVIEMDAASQTSVDDIRMIIESSEYKPLLGSYKIFIIDEVHMLSKSAFNALLKLLEAPPLHVMFIFATTELQKIPLTVISRCQRYDLKHLTIDELINILKSISAQENIKYNLKALTLIARKAQGSARDAIMLLEKANSSILGSNEEVTEIIVNDIIGAVSLNIIIDFTKAVIKKDAKSALKIINQIYQNSADLISFIQETAELIAYLSKHKVISDYVDSNYSVFNSEISEMLLECDITKLSLLWQILTKGLDEVKIATSPLITAEMMVIKAIFSQKLPSLIDLGKAGDQPNEAIIVADQPNIALPRQR